MPRVTSSRFNLLKRRILLSAAGAGVFTKAAEACDPLPSRRTTLGKLLIPDAEACGATSPVFNGNFTNSPQQWMPHRAWQPGDQWSYGIPGNTSGSAPDGASDGANTWWVNPLATPQGAGLFSQSSAGLKLGLQVTPGGTPQPGGGTISQNRMGTILGNRITPGGNFQLFGYYESVMSIPAVPGFFMGWDIEDVDTTNPNFTFGAEINCYLWTDGSGTQWLWFQANSVVGGSNIATDIFKQPVNATGLHKYAVDWQSDFVRCFVDDVQVGSSYANTQGGLRTNPMFCFLITADATMVGSAASSAASLPVFGTIQYFDVWHTKPTVVVTPAISDIVLSNSGLTLPVASGATVGTFSVAMNTGTFTGTLNSPPGGTDGASFTVASNVLKFAVVPVARTYAITETATQAGIGNSPLTKAFNIIVSPAGGGGGTGPTASSSFITVDFQSAFNIPTTSRQQVVTQKMNGCFIGWGGDPGDNADLGPRGPDNRAFSAYSSNTWTSQAALVNFGIHQVTGNLWPNGWFNGDDTVNHNGLDNLINNFYKVDPLGVAGIMWGMNFGYPNSDDNTNGGDSTRYAKAYSNLAKYIEGPAGIMPNGKRLPLIGFGSSNEPNQNSEGTIAQFFNAFVPAVKAVNPNYLIKGPQFSSLYRGNTQNFISACNPKPDGIDWDAFSSGDTGPQGSKVYLDSNFTNSVGDSVASGVLPSGYTPKFTCGMGNTTFNCSSTTDVDGVNGAMFWAMNWFNGLAGSRGWDIWMGAWDDGGQGSCGIITDQNNFALSASGYLFGMQIRNLFGPRWQVITNGSGLTIIATTPGSGRFGMMIANPGLGSKSGSIALSHWPVNSSGTSTINKWQMTNSVTTFGQDGTHSTVNVTAGVVPSMSFPDPSVTFLYV